MKPADLHVALQFGLDLPRLIIMQALAGAPKLPAAGFELVLRPPFLANDTPTSGYDFSLTVPFEYPHLAAPWQVLGGQIGLQLAVRFTKAKADDPAQALLILHVAPANTWLVTEDGPLLLSTMRTWTAAAAKAAVDAKVPVPPTPYTIPAGPHTGTGIRSVAAALMLTMHRLQSASAGQLQALTQGLPAGTLTGLLNLLGASGIPKAPDFIADTDEAVAVALAAAFATAGVAKHVASAPERLKLLDNATANQPCPLGAVFVATDGPLLTAVKLVQSLVPTADANDKVVVRMGSVLSQPASDAAASSWSIVAAAAYSQGKSSVGSKAAQDASKQEAQALATKLASPAFLQPDWPIPSWRLPDSECTLAIGAKVLDVVVHHGVASEGPIDISGNPCLAVALNQLDPGQDPAKLKPFLDAYAASKGATADSVMTTEPGFKAFLEQALFSQAQGLASYQACIAKYDPLIFFEHVDDLEMVYLFVPGQVSFSSSQVSLAAPGTFGTSEPAGAIVVDLQGTLQGHIILDDFWGVAIAWVFDPKPIHVRVRLPLLVVPTSESIVGAPVIEKLDIDKGAKVFETKPDLSVAGPWYVPDGVTAQLLKRIAGKVKYRIDARLNSQIKQTLATASDRLGSVLCLSAAAVQQGVLVVQADADVVTKLAAAMAKFSHLSLGVSAAWNVAEVSSVPLALPLAFPPRTTSTQFKVKAPTAYDPLTDKPLPDSGYYLAQALARQIRFTPWMSLKFGQPMAHLRTLSAGIFGPPNMRTESVPPDLTLKVSLVISGDVVTLGPAMRPYVQLAHPGPSPLPVHYFKDASLPEEAAGTTWAPTASVTRRALLLRPPPAMAGELVTALTAGAVPGSGALDPAVADGGLWAANYWAQAQLDVSFENPAAATLWGLGQIAFFFVGAAPPSPPPGASAKEVATHKEKLATFQQTKTRGDAFSAIFGISPGAWGIFWLVRGDAVSQSVQMSAKSPKAALFRANFVADFTYGLTATQVGGSPDDGPGNVIAAIKRGKGRVPPQGILRTLSTGLDDPVWARAVDPVGITLRAQHILDRRIASAAMTDAVESLVGVSNQRGPDVDDDNKVEIRSVGSRHEFGRQFATMDQPNLGIDERRLVLHELVGSLTKRNR